MDRNKATASGRGSKNKITHIAQDIFALGSKNTVPVVSRDAEAKRNIHKPSSSGSDRKRDGSSSSSVPPKKPKLSTPVPSSPAEPMQPTVSLDIEPVDLVSSVLAAQDTHNTDKLLGLLTGAIRLLKAQRWKPDLILCHSLIYIGKIRPNMFANETVTQSLCSLLKRETGTAFKSKGNPLVFVLACNLLYAGHRESKNWPDTFIKHYIEDALNERWWVDCVWCKCLVENITTAFNTTTPPSHLIPTESNTLGTMSPSGSPLLGSNEEDGDHTELDYTVFPRYSSSYEKVEGLVLEAIKDQLSRRAAPDGIGKGFLKLLSATCGFPEIRMIAACRLEAWLNSGKLWRPAQELMAGVCCNVRTGGSAAQRDNEVLAQLARMRLKTKPLVAAYVACLREMVSESETTLRSVITHTVYNELSNVRNPNNMAVLAALVQAQPQAVPQAIAETYQELLVRPEEFLRPIRALTRELTRAGRVDAVAALAPLCHALAAPPTHEPPAEVRERAFSSIADLFCLCCMVSATHAKHLPDCRQQIAAIQGDATSWLLDTAMPIYRPAQSEYVQALHKIMFLDAADTYSKLDNWPPDSERTLTYRVSCEVPLQQNTLVRIIFIGLSKELPVSPGEAFELVEQLVRRACALPPDDNPLPVDKLELADYIFQLCQYHHPENITLPAGYTAPSLAITSLYWRAWIVLVMLAAHNPHTFAREAFHKYPTLKALIEMCITNKFVCDWTTAGDTEAERSAILQLETHLATATNAKLPITELTSRLLSQLTSMEPTGPAVRPPAAATECLQSLCGQLRLGRLLCRQPALLLDIVERHGTKRAMPWLHDLLHNSEQSLSVLPVQCLCEFLVGGGGAEGGGGGKALELARHLQRVVAGDAEGSRAVLSYYLQRLAHPHATVRAQANRGLKLVLIPINADESSEVEWNASVSPEEWLCAIGTCTAWEGACDEAATAVRAACLVEAEPRRLAAYIIYLARHAAESVAVATDNAPDTMQDLVLDLSQLIVERMTIMSSILPIMDHDSVNPDAVETEEDALGPHHTLYALSTIFHNYMQRVREHSRESGVAYEWCASQERVLLQWAGGEHCTLHILVAHAAVILLCYGPSLLDDDGMLYSWSLALWFGSDSPKAYLVDTSEEALLLPDWLRLRMVRSARPALVEAGLRGLDAHQLALFIQSFGIPVPSMSALLHALDECSTESVLRLGVERGYMAQLVAVQRARGAAGGERFSAALALHEPEYAEDELFLEKPAPEKSEIDMELSAEQGESELSVEQVALILDSTFLRAEDGTGDVDSSFTLLQTLLADEIRQMKWSPQRAVDCPLLQSTCANLTMVLNGASCYNFIRNFLAKPTHSTTLMRILLNCQGTVFQRNVLLIAESMLKHYKCADGPLVVILKEIVSVGKSKSIDSADANVRVKDEKNLVSFSQIQAAVTKEDLARVMESSTPNTLEQIGNKIIETHDTKVVLEAITAVLEKSLHGDYEKSALVSVKVEEGADVGVEHPEHIFSERGMGCGLLIDWMSELQPETLGEDPEVQMRLMFKAGEGGARWRPLLVSLLAHRASWSTLHTCLTTLLQYNGDWQASSVLELVSALTRSPRVWQGRDKSTPKHYTPEDVLRLNHHQLAALVMYILKEASHPRFEQNVACQRIEARLPLLLECCSRDDAALLAAVSGAEMQLHHTDQDQASVSRLFLLLLYMRVPKVMRLLGDGGEGEGRAGGLLPVVEGGGDATDESSSVVDKIAHCLFTALAATAHSATKDWHKRLSGIESACRALCRRHWRLAARQLPLLGALLGGLEARAGPRGGLALHGLALSALEAMPSPALFAEKHRRHLHTILDCYMGAAWRLTASKDTSPLLHRLAALLRRYAAHDPPDAHRYLQKHKDVVASYPALSALVCVGGDGAGGGEGEGGPGGVVTAAPSSAAPPPQALFTLQRRPPAQSSPADLTNALQDLEAWGIRRGGAWGGGSSAAALLSATAPLTSHPSPAVHSAALSLLTKLLPAVDDTTPGLSALMHCLDPSHPDIALAALSRLPELVVCMQEHASRLLLRAFQLGVRSKINTDTCIARCVTTINLHRGC